MEFAVSMLLAMKVLIVVKSPSLTGTSPLQVSPWSSQCRPQYQRIWRAAVPPGGQAEVYPDISAARNKKRQRRKITRGRSIGERG